jgi:hypothetical protein
MSYNFVFKTCIWWYVNLTAVQISLQRTKIYTSVIKKLEFPTILALGLQRPDFSAKVTSFFYSICETN